MTGPAGGSPLVLYRFADARIDEASGIAAGVRSPGVDYVQNDSGDAARFFAVNAATGRTAATVTVPGATNVDWEDLAVAPDPAGRSSVWLADIGDNDAVRREIRVYRVDEPRIAAGSADSAVRTATPDVWRLRYPNGATDAESLAVAPDGTAYVVTKSVVGTSVVYRLPRRPDAERVQTLVPVGHITFPARSNDTPFGTLGSLTATGAALSRDGALLAVRTYADAYVWRVRDGDVTAALQQRPTRVALPPQRQGEGIGFDGARLIVDSEGAGAPVYAVPVPAALTRPAARSSVPQPNASSLNHGSLPLTFASSASSSGDGSAAGVLWLGGGAAALAAAGAASTVAWRRRGRAQRAR